MLNNKYHREPTAITTEYLDQILRENSSKEYIVFEGYEAHYDGGDKALDNEVIFNYMYKNGYQFVQLYRNPVFSGFYSNIEYVFKKI